MEKRFVQTLNLHGGAPVVGVRYVRGDIDVYPLELYLVNRNIPFTIPDNATVFINFIRPDGVVDRAPTDILEAAKGHVAYKIQGSEISVVGTVRTYVEIVTANQTLTFEQRLAIEVLPNPDGQSVEVPGKFALWTTAVDMEIVRIDKEILRLAALIGSGGGGSGGNNGWSPMIGIAEDGERSVLRLYDWAGGTGAKPVITGYLGNIGIVDDIAEAVNIRGLRGADGERGLPGEKGDKGDPGEPGSGSQVIGFESASGMKSIALKVGQNRMPVETDISTVVNGTDFIVPKEGWWQISIAGEYPANPITAIAVWAVKNGLNMGSQKEESSWPQVSMSTSVYAYEGDEIYYIFYANKAVTVDYRLSAVYLG